MNPPLYFFLSTQILYPLFWSFDWIWWENLQIDPEYRVRGVSCWFWLWPILLDHDDYGFFSGGCLWGNYWIAILISRRFSSIDSFSHFHFSINWNKICSDSLHPPNNKYYHNNLILLINCYILVVCLTMALHPLYKLIIIILIISW